MAARRFTLAAAVAAVFVAGLTIAAGVVNACSIAGLALALLAAVLQVLFDRRQPGDVAPAPDSFLDLTSCGSERFGSAPVVIIRRRHGQALPPAPTAGDRKAVRIVRVGREPAPDSRF